MSYAAYPGLTPGSCQRVKFTPHEILSGGVSRVGELFFFLMFFFLKFLDFGVVGNQRLLFLKA